MNTIHVISVLMPVYNAERFLVEAVESIVTQTFTDFEFLIVDDGSTDASLAILRKYAARDPRIRLISRPNTGIAVALNEMLQLARGEFVARMDSDDVSLPDRFERQVAFLRANPDVLAVGGAYTITDQNGGELTTIRPPEQDPEIQARALSGLMAICHPTAMLRREALDAVGGYRKELVPAEDLDLWLRLGERGGLANLAQVVLRYREHGGSICGQNQQLQLDRLQQAADEAADRRGLPRRSIDLRPGRPSQDRRIRHQFALRDGWWAYLRGDRSAAIRCGVRAIAYQPWVSDGWRLLACALVKPIRRPPV
jgi:glycosyltransferase involved in cell wall biosynthesis